MSYCVSHQLGSAGLDESDKVSEKSIEVYERPRIRGSEKQMLNAEWLRSNVLERRKRCLRHLIASLSLIFFFQISLVYERVQFNIA